MSASPPSSTSASPPAPLAHAPLVRKRVGALEVLLAPRPGSGLIVSQVYLRRASADESAEEFGLASFTASMLKRGTRARNSEQLNFDLESLGALTGHSAGIDAATSGLRSAADDFPEALPIFFECLQQPAFDARELELERQSVLAYLNRIEDDKLSFTYRHYVERIFAGHGYGHHVEGTPEEVARITPEVCRAWHNRMYRPEQMLFVASGDFEVDAMMEWLAPLAQGWPDGAGEPVSRYDRMTTDAARAGISNLESTPDHFEIEKDLEQGFVVAGFKAPEHTHPDYHALRLASAVLGEGFSGRLFSNLRDRRSLAYAVGSSLRSHRLGGHMMMYIGTQPERLDEALAGLLGEAENLTREGITEDDLTRARNYVSGLFLMGRQSLGARVSQMAHWEDLGLGADYDARYLDDLNAVTTEAVVQAARKYWRDPVIVVLRPKS